MLTSYHNHSRLSDGFTLPKYLVVEALRLGIDELGISDHLVLDPHGYPPDWSMPPEELPAYLDTLEALQADDGPTLRIGIELDWIPGQGDAIAAALDDPRFDYAIGSVHQVSGMHVDSAQRRLNMLDPGAMERLYYRYWELVRDMARSGLFQVAAHLDLPRKLLSARSVVPWPDQAPNVGEALDAITEAGMVVELNTAGWAMPSAECYPSPRLLAACKERGIPMTISADAHSAQDLLRDFERAVDTLRALGITEVARLEQRRIIMQPLDDFEARLKA